MCQSSIQSDNSIESYGAAHDLLYRQTDTFVKTVFSDSGGLKTQIFDENFESHFSHKTNTFSCDENVKIRKISCIIFATFAKISAVNPYRGWLQNKFFFIGLILLYNVL